MKVTALGSGSKGNCMLVEGESGSLLVDAGLAAREIQARLALAGADPGSIEAILVTHEHTDHIRGLDVMARRFGIPVIATRGTLAEFFLHRKVSKKTVTTVTTITCHPGTALEVGGFTIEPFSVSHDAQDPCGYCIEEQSARLGYCTDTGVLSGEVIELFRRCDGLVLESNHCPQMLEDGPYPAMLKRRIRSRRGHLSNEQAGACLQLLGHDLGAVMLAHLSETNNTPAVAEACAQGALGLFVDDVDLQVALQETISAPMEI
jgi:phosphoribosyl 1,2-cyclic phosphodiesterase